MKPDYYFRTSWKKCFAASLKYQVPFLEEGSELCFQEDLSNTHTFMNYPNSNSG